MYFVTLDNELITRILSKRREFHYIVTAENKTNKSGTIQLQNLISNLSCNYKTVWDLKNYINVSYVNKFNRKHKTDLIVKNCNKLSP